MLYSPKYLSLFGTCLLWTMFFISFHISNGWRFVPLYRRLSSLTSDYCVFVYCQNHRARRVRSQLSRSPCFSAKKICQSSRAKQLGHVAGREEVSLTSTNISDHVYWPKVGPAMALSTSHPTASSLSYFRYPPRRISTR